MLALVALCALPLVAGTRFAAGQGAHSNENPTPLDKLAIDFIDAVPTNTHELLASILTAEQLRQTYLTLGHTRAHGSIGPLPDFRPDLSNMPRRTIRLPLEGAEGDGSEHAPWRGAIAKYLSAYSFPEEPKKFTVKQWETIDPDAVRRYMAQLSYAPITIVLPAGQYIEDTVRLPPGIWLVADGNAGLRVLPPARRMEPAGAFVRMHTRSGLVNMDIDGSNIEEFVPGPPFRINGVSLQHYCEIHNCRIHHWPGSGIRADGKRSRKSNWCRVTNNIIEHVGYSGARLGSNALFENNQVRYCGVLRPSGGGGDDGVIAEYSSDATISNNLCVGRKMPHGRHVISGQKARNSKVLGNISIAEGPMRNNIGFSDGAHFNEFVGNVILGLGSGGGIQAGVSNSGNGAIIRHNASIGNTRAFRNRSRCAQTSSESSMSLIADNYGLFQKSPIHRSNCYVERNNNLARLAHPLSLEVDYENFGFFVWK